MCSFPFLAELPQLQVILMFQNSEAPVWSLVPFVLHSFLAAQGLPCCSQALSGCRRQGLPQLVCPGLWLRWLRPCRARALHHGLSTGGCGWPWLLSVMWDLLGPEKIGRQMLHCWTTRGVPAICSVIQQILFAWCPRNSHGTGMVQKPKKPDATPSSFG